MGPSAEKQIDPYRILRLAVDALLRPYAAAEMECYPVSTAVNNVRNEGVVCVERADADAPMRPPMQMQLF